MSTRWVVRLTLLIFVAYCIWAIGPFVRSVFVRDAALTAWSRTVVAPIAGRLGRELPSVGFLVPDDGMLTTISNPLLLTELQALDRTSDRIKSARNEIKESEQFLKELKELEDRFHAIQSGKAEITKVA